MAAALVGLAALSAELEVLSAGLKNNSKFVSLVKFLGAEEKPKGFIQRKNQHCFISPNKLCNKKYRCIFPFLNILINVIGWLKGKIAKKLHNLMD